MVALTSGAVPEVTSVTMEQTSAYGVTIRYTLENAPAVVTLDIQTNATANAQTGWVSVGGHNLRRVTSASDVFRKVGVKSAYEIRWKPETPLADQKIEDGCVRAVVTAWAPDDTPDYMVVNIGADAAADSARYYPDESYLPGGLLGNDAYRTTSIVMRRMHAENVPWTMGSVNEAGRVPTREYPHTVTLANDYYIGVFPVTQAQWALVQTAKPTVANFGTQGAMRPVEQVSYYDIRCSDGYPATSAASGDTEYPNNPHANSFLGLLRAKSGLAFDLPSDAQWEFACRAGHGEGLWGDGSAYVSDNNDPNLPGRFKHNGGYVNGSTKPANAIGPENGTAIVGTYSPNSWGLYDMHGNVWEWCLDTAMGDIRQNSDGAVVTTGSTSKILRGGCWNGDAKFCRSAQRDWAGPTSRNQAYGFRLACPVR